VRRHTPYAADFGPFDGRVWLNAAHQGPLPRVAADAAWQAVADKVAPHRLADAAFVEVPRRLRTALARLINAEPDDVVLGNSASYGLDLLAHALRWRVGDEILFVDGEFPATVIPWRVLERQGVALRFLAARAGGAPEPDELAAALGARTRVVCTSWVNSFSGHAIDADALGRVCRAAGVAFVLNASQGLGARVLDVSTMAVDAVTCCGYKWLLGPYGTGFCWIAPALRATLEPPHAYWLPNVWGQPGGMQRCEVRPGLGARALDVFCPASFLNAVPWTAAVEYLLSAGPAVVERYTQGLVERLLARVDRDRYTLVSPAAGARRSTLVVLRPTGRGDAEVLHGALTAAGIDAALREGAVRFSPHLYNTVGEIDRATAALMQAADRKG
jgi:selenocysteine lyase/cysteine desulfurase